MSTDPIVLALVERLDEIANQIADLEVQRDRARAALDALTAAAGPETITPPATVEQHAAKKAAAGGKATKGSTRQKGPAKPCRFECGFEHDWAPSLARHESVCTHRIAVGKTPTVTAVPPAATTPTPRPTTGPATLPDGKVLACVEQGCGHETGSIHALAAHTDAEHSRQPYKEERWPVTPAPVAS